MSSRGSRITATGIVRAGAESVGAQNPGPAEDSQGADLGPPETRGRSAPVSRVPPSLEGDMASLAVELRRLNGHRFIRIHNSTRKLVWFQFMRGLAFGLGSAVGATALVSVVVLLLSQIEFIPILGSWATSLIEEIETRPE